jgi:taurine dioxygenase
MEFNKIMVEPLTVNIGAEIHGVDLAKLDDATFDEIHRAFLRYQVIFFRDQELTREQHLSFGRLFGKLHIHPAAPSPEGYPEVTTRTRLRPQSGTRSTQASASLRAITGTPTYRATMSRH